MEAPSQEPLHLSSEDLLLIQQALRNYVAAPSVLHNDLFDLYDRLDRYRRNERPSS